MMLRNNGLVGSMGRVASAGDIAAMESVFALHQRNVLNRRQQARDAGPDVWTPSAGRLKASDREEILRGCQIVCVSDLA